MAAVRRSVHEVNGVGEVLLVRRKGAKRLSIRLRPLEPIRCLAPAHVPVDEALDFVRKKRAWIIRHRERLDEVEEGNTVFREGTVFKTQFHTLSVERDHTDTLRAEFAGREVRVTAPRDCDFSADEVQAFIRSMVEKVLRREALAVLPYRLATLARRAGLTYTGLSFRAQRRRWGSCSAADRISLNVHLMRLPEALIDYVLLHELAHIRHKNHSGAYWDYLDQLTGGRARELDRELRRYSPTVF